MKIQFLIIFLFSLLLLSCSEGLLGDMLRVITDPVVVEPSVTSFEKEETIKITWNADPGADEYILYKAEDAFLPVYEIIYQGPELSVSDTDVNDENLYIYTLGKVRGTKLFGPSDPVLGVGSTVLKDEHETNDKKENSTRLVWDLDANLYYYISHNRSEVKDYDWYHVTVPPNRQANIVLVQNGLVIGNTWMNFSLESQPPEPITNNQAIHIRNTTLEEKTYNFLISPIPEDFYGDPPTSSGSLINYRIFVDSITGIVY